MVVGVVGVVEFVGVVGVVGVVVDVELGGVVFPNTPDQYVNKHKDPPLRSAQSTPVVSDLGLSSLPRSSSFFLVLRSAQSTPDVSGTGAFLRDPVVPRGSDRRAGAGSSFQ